MNSNYYIIKFFDEESFIKESDEFDKEVDDCEIRFKKDLFNEFNLKEEKAEKLFELALEYDSSYEGIYSFFEKIANLIK